MRDPDCHTRHNINYYQMDRKKIDYENSLQTIINITDISIIYQWNGNVEIGINNINN